MKTSMLKELISEAYIGIICCLIGFVTLFALRDQILILGINVFNADPIKPVSYAKAESNITSLFLFALVSVPGIVYGVSKLLMSFIGLIKRKDNTKDGGAD